MNPEKIFDALAFAAEKHRRQRRKDQEATPYINHLIAVSAELAVEGGVTDEATLMCALLHDTVEDTATTFDELTQRFGSEVAELVREVSDDKSLEKSERKRLQIEHARGATPRAKQVKIADKIANIRDVAANPPTHWPLQRRLDYFTWSEQVVAGCRGVNPKLDLAFDRAIALARQTIEPQS